MSFSRALLLASLLFAARAFAQDAPQQALDAAAGIVEGVGHNASTDAG